ncbi:hypothetical protein ACA910_017506 [Epithemia clementina (nom. ined.)]
MDSSDTTTSVTSSISPPLSSSAVVNQKNVYLIRHAESEENQRLSSLKTVGQSMARFTLPSRRDISSSLQLLNVPAQVDTPLSPAGMAQVSNVARQLEESKFFETHNIQLVAYSPLERARDTAAGLLSPSNSSHNNNGAAEGVVAAVPTTTTAERLLQASNPRQRVVECEHLMERQLSEWIPGNSGSMWRRIADLESWLAAQPETNIVCVGHSQYFKAMLHLDFKFGNCDVWQVQFHPSSLQPQTPAETTTTTTTTTTASTSNEYPNLPPQWSGLKRLYQVIQPDT